jgi:hypothetical protein
MKICTRIGVFADDLDVGPLVTLRHDGHAVARGPAPSVTPITEAPTIANAETFSVRMSPSRSSRQFSETMPQRS